MGGTAESKLVAHVELVVHVRSDGEQSGLDHRADMTAQKFGSCANVFSRYCNFKILRVEGMWSSDYSIIVYPLVGHHMMVG